MEVLGEKPAVTTRAGLMLREHQLTIWSRTDRLLSGLLMFEWFAAIILALWLTPRTWDGPTSSVHSHIWVATLLGGAIVSLPLYLVMKRPGAGVTRQVVGVSQMLMSGMLIHLGGGRVEMHFHIFGSLAFLAFYRDWRVLVTASAVVALDHLFRGIYFPASVYGDLGTNSLRTLEHVGWVVFEDIFLIAACLQGVREMNAIAQRQALLEDSYATIEQKVQERTRQLKEAQADLVEVARSAGMAEIATSVLHNVGNVLNSLNVSVSVAATKVQQSPVENFSKAVAMMNDHTDDLGEFLSNDVKGRQITPFLGALVEVFSEEQAALLAEMASLAKNVEHIKHIVNVQQSHAKCGAEDTAVEVQLTGLIDDALSVNSMADPGCGIRVVRHVKPLTVFTYKHAVLQILINLVRNAKYAVMMNPPENRRLEVRAMPVEGREPACLRIEVSDNGSGISPENLKRLFHHGFTTKHDGHGFGLHSSAIAAKQLGGTLSGNSEGLGLGAEFILEIPLIVEQVNA